MLTADRCSFGFAVSAGTSRDFGEVFFGPGDGIRGEDVGDMRAVEEVRVVYDA